MNNFVKKITSRKLWLAISGVATGIALILGVDGSEIKDIAGAFVSLISIVTYIVAEGNIDAESIKAIANLQQKAEIVEGTDIDADSE